MLPPQGQQGGLVARGENELAGGNQGYGQQGVGQQGMGQQGGGGSLADSARYVKMLCRRCPCSVSLECGPVIHPVILGGGHFNVAKLGKRLLNPRSSVQAPALAASTLRSVPTMST